MEKYLIYGVGILAVMSYAFLAPIIKQPSLVVSPFLIMAFNSIIILACSLPLYYFSAEKTVLSDLEPKIWGLILANGLINVLAFWLLLKALGGMPVWHYQMLVVASPIFSAIAAYFLLREDISVRLFVGLAIVSVGIFIAVKPS